MSHDFSRDHSTNLAVFFLIIQIVKELHKTNWILCSDSSHNTQVKKNAEWKILSIKTAGSNECKKCVRCEKISTKH